MKVGTRLEQYEVGEKIGEGGMGAVYRAEDTRLKRPVAIKVLPPEVSSDAERLARLEREAQLLASLNHPNVATLYGFGEAVEGQRFLLSLFGNDGEPNQVQAIFDWRRDVGR